MIKKSKQAIRKLIPFYISFTLSAEEMKTVERAINRDEQLRSEVNTWKQVQLALSGQPERDPSPLVWQRLLATAHNTAAGRLSFHLKRSLLAGTVLTLVVFIFLWLAIRPGVVLQWSHAQDGMVRYQVYRAFVGSSQFELIKEVTAQAEREKYSYVDPVLIPGKEYVYRVEAFPAEGMPSFSQEVYGNYMEILPGQLALLFISIITGYGIVFLIQSWPVLSRQKMRSKIAI